jgi:hypothetical protein
MEKDFAMYGTKIYDYDKKSIGLLINTWTNKFADGDVDFVTCVDKKGKLYNTAMDNITPIEN